MSTTAPHASSGAAAPTRCAVELEQLAWIAAPPCALLLTAAIVLLGPPLGHALLSSGYGTFWPSQGAGNREGVEHARFAIAVLGGAPLLAAATLLAARHRPALRLRTSRLLALCGQLLLVAFLALTVLAQHNILFRSFIPPQIPVPMFSRPTLAFATGLPLVLLALARVGAIHRAAARLARETRVRRHACLLVATALTATWLLSAFNFEDTIGRAAASNLIPWDMSETFAVLDGRTPFVDFHSQYAQLWPYFAAAVMALTGRSSVGVWTLTMTCLSGASLLAIYAVVRRILHSSLLALVAYAPFLATGFFVIGNPATPVRLSPVAIFSLWPLRYAGPYLLAWLTARHLDREVPRRALALFLAAGVVALNNVEFGVPALAGTLVAVALRRRVASSRAAGRLAAEAAGGLLGAAALVALLTVARTGELPRFQLLIEFARIYGSGGWVLEPMSPMGFHLAMYVTLVAAVVLAVLRATRPHDDAPVLTGMLAWSGVFGLLASSYFAGRSEALNLISMFSAWTLALLLLTIAVARALAAHGWRFPTLAELSVLTGFGLAVCSIAQIPPPWQQLDRLGKRTPTLVFEQPKTLRFVAAATRPGERVAILTPLGHRVAYDLGLSNVAPYASIEAMPTKEQFATTLDAMRREHVHKVFLDLTVTGAEVIAAFKRVGFVERVEGSLVELTD